MTRSLRAALVAAFLPLSACGGGLIPPAPVTPAPIDIENEAGSLDAIKAAPTDVLSIGVELSNRLCTAYFNNLTDQASQLSFAQQETTLAGGVATGVAGISGASAGTTAILGIIFPALSQSMANAARAATGGVAPPTGGPVSPHVVPGVPRPPIVEVR